MNLFASFRGMKKEKKRPLILRDTALRGKITSPYVVSLRNAQKEIAEKNLDSFWRKRNWQKFAQSPFQHLGKYREMFRMGVSVTIILVLIFSAAALGKITSFAGETLPQEKEKISAEIDALLATTKDMNEAAPALRSFSEALQSSALSLEQYAGFVSEKLPLESGLQATTALIHSGQIFSDLAQKALAEKEYFLAQVPLLISGEASFLPLLQHVEQFTRESLSQLQQVQELFAQVKKFQLPAEVSEKLERAAPFLTTAQNLGNSFLSALPALRTLLGEKHPHTIFFLLQNRNEIRATGGFPGNTLEVVFDQGKISSWQMTDIFAYSGQMTVDIPVPEEFAHLTGGFFIHDCNRDPDFPTAAEECRFFLEHSKGNTPDTVVAINQDILTDFLNLTGPLELPDVGVTLDAETASFTLSYVIEAKIFGTGGENSPKKFLEKLFPVLLQKLPEIPLQELIKLPEKWAQNKSVQLYSRSELLENFWKKLNLSGEFLPAAERSGDFLGLVQANIGGNKSDAFMVQNISETSLINLAGEMFHTVKIERTDTWGEKEAAAFAELFKTFGAQKIDRESLEKIMGAGKNKVFTRLYFPKGTRLLSAKGVLSTDVKVEEQADATVFSFFFPEVAPGETEEAELFVAAPQKIDLRSGAVLPFFAPVQSGAGEQYFTKKFVAESGVEISAQEFNHEKFNRNLYAAYLIKLAE